MGRDLNRHFDRWWLQMANKNMKDAKHHRSSGKHKSTIGTTTHPLEWLKFKSDNKCWCGCGTTGSHIQGCKMVHTCWNSLAKS